MNLSERLAKAAMDRGTRHDAGAPRVPATDLGATPTDTPSEEATSPLLPDLFIAPTAPSTVTAMKMRLPEPTGPKENVEPTTGLPLWERPVADVLRDRGLATVTSLPLPRDQAADDHNDDGPLAKAIPMPGIYLPPPLATAEAQGLARVSLSADDGGDYPVAEMAGVIDLDDLPVEENEPIEEVAAPHVEVVLPAKVQSEESPLLERLQPGRVTFGPIDLRDEIRLPRADGEHSCPNCGAQARIDIHDPMRGRIHLSCDSCFKMWQERIQATAKSDQPFMRD